MTDANGRYSCPVSGDLFKHANSRRALAVRSSCNRTAVKQLAARFVALLAVLFSVGCQFSNIEYTETKRIDERLSEAEIQKFLSIVNSLPEKKLPELPQIFVPTPDWNQTRTLPVSELLREEEKLLEERWSVDTLAKYVSKNRRLLRALNRNEMTPKQFMGLTLTIGAAMSKGMLRETQDLDAILKKGNEVLERIVDDGESFASLPREKRYYILQQAAWLTRVDRARKLKIVPDENVVLANRHRERLAEIFPPEFSVNPFDSIMDLLDERGLPFEELSESGFDDQIDWRPNDAVIGTDQPDPDFTAPYSAGPPADEPEKAEL